MAAGTTNFPTTLDSRTPKTSADVIASVHVNNNNIAIEAIEAKVGVDNSAVVTSLDYLIKNTSSINPGHKHSVLYASDGAPAALTADANGDMTAGGNIAMGDNAGPTILNEAATATNPTLIPNKAETDTGFGWAAADTLTVITGGVERMRIDSSGNVGIGVTPKSWISGYSILQLGGDATFMANNTAGASHIFHIGQNSYHNGSNWLYMVTDEASDYRLGDGTHQWRVAASGTAGNTINYAIALTIQNDASLLALPTYSQDVGGTTRDLLIDDTGLIGYQASSKRYKTNIQDMGEFSNRIYDLRPVNFQWKKDKADDFGLIAEEVYKTFPELVSLNEKGRPETVNYKMLSVLLLNEFKSLKK